MYEDYTQEQPHHDAAPVSLETASAPEPQPQVIWMDTPADEAAGREADPYAVINFLLRKIEEQQVRLGEMEGFSELQNQEIEQLRGQVEVTRQELDLQVSDNEVLMRNVLAAEQELEAQRLKSAEKTKIQLPFHTEQKLAKLGWTEEGERQAG